MNKTSVTAEMQANAHQIPPHLVNRQIGRYANSPARMETELIQQRDEMMKKFNQDYEMLYLKDQVRRMESPELTINTQPDVNPPAVETTPTKQPDSPR